MLAGPGFDGACQQEEDAVYVDDLDIPVSKLTEAAQRVMDRAVEEFAGANIRCSPAHTCFLPLRKPSGICSRRRCVTLG